MKQHSWREVNSSSLGQKFLTWSLDGSKLVTTTHNIQIEGCVVPGSVWCLWRRQNSSSEWVTVWLADLMTFLCDFWTHWLGFAPRVHRVGFVLVNKVTQGQIFVLLSQSLFHQISMCVCHQVPVQKISSTLNGVSGIVTRLRTRRSVFRIAAGTKGFSLLQNVQTVSVTQPPIQ